MSALPTPATMLRPSPLPEMTTFVVHNSGPFYVYAPGEPIHRVDAADSAPHLWAGMLIPVTDFPKVLDVNMSGIHVAGMSSDGKKTVNRTWASHIADIIHRPYFPRAVQITALDAKPLVQCHDDFSVTDNLLSEFNRMICPYPVAFEPWDVPEAARNIRLPQEVVDFIAQDKVGVLGYRDKCLQDAEQLCGDSETGRYLRQAIDQMRGAIKTYRDFANSYLDLEERAIERQSKGEAGKAVYDDYDRRLLWLLGRKERKYDTQVIVQQASQPMTMGADFAATFGAAMGDAIAKAVAPLQAEIESMKKKQVRRPSLIKRDVKPEEKSEE